MMSPQFLTPQSLWTVSNRSRSDTMLDEAGFPQGSHRWRHLCRQLWLRPGVLLANMPGWEVMGWLWVVVVGNITAAAPSRHR